MWLSKSPDENRNCQKLFRKLSSNPTSKVFQNKLNEIHKLIDFISTVRSPYKRPADKKSPVPERRSALDRIDRTAVAGVKRKKVASPTPAPVRTKGHHGATRKKKSSSSGSGSSSGSESDSSYSSSTSSTKAKKLAGSKREKVVAERKVTKKGKISFY